MAPNTKSYASSSLVTFMRLKEEQNTTSTTDQNNNSLKTDDHQPVHLQLKRSSTEQGLNRTNNLDQIELKELNNNVVNKGRSISPVSIVSSPHCRQPSPSQFSFNNLNNHHHNLKCNGVCVITNEPKQSSKPSTHRHLATSHSNGTAIVPQKIHIQLNSNAFFSPSLNNLNALNTAQHSPLVPSYLSNSSKYTGYSTYGKLTHGTDHLPTTSSLCIDNIHSKTKIFNFKVVVIGDMASGKTSYIRKLTQPKNGSRNRYNYYMATCDTMESASHWSMPDMLDSFCKKNNILTFFYASVRRNMNLENICYDLIGEMLIRYQRKKYKTFNSNHHKKKSLKKFYKCSNCTIL